MSDSIHCAIEQFLTLRCVICGDPLPEAPGAGRPRSTCKGENGKLSPCRAHLNNSRRRIETRKKRLVSALGEAWLCVQADEGIPEADWGEITGRLGALLKAVIDTSPPALTDLNVVRDSFNHL